MDDSIEDIKEEFIRGSERGCGAFPAKKPHRQAAELAIETLIRWIGDEPKRPGLHETPARVVRALEEWFRGYTQNPDDLLRKTFNEIGSYDDPVELRNIPFHSFCEHHMAPIRGKAHIAYLPDQKVVGISKLARLVEAFSCRLQIQERLTDNIATAINRSLSPRGVAVIIEATHDCMTSRGVMSRGSYLETKKFLGAYINDVDLRRNFEASLQDARDREPFKRFSI